MLDSKGNHLSPRRVTELAEHVAYVMLDRPLADEQFASDLAITDDPEQPGLALHPLGG